MKVGSQSMVDELKFVLVKHPRASHGSQAQVDAQWQALNYPARPDYDLVQEEFAAFSALLEGAGIEIGYLPAATGTTPDSIYTHDPVAAVSTRGVILGSMGKAARTHEPDAMAAYLDGIGVPILGRISGAGRVEGGDVCWLDESTVAVGQGYRTNGEGIRQMRALLGTEIEVIPVPLPHWTGPDECLHLLSFISPVDRDLAVVYSRMMPVPFRELLIARGIQLVEVPDEEYDNFACNVLAVAPRQAIMIQGSPITQARLEAAGARVQRFPGGDLCIKGGGGPTCLTRPILRG